MSLPHEAALRVNEVHLGHWNVRISGPELFVRALTRVLQPLALPHDDLPPLLVTIAPDGQYAVGTIQASLKWSVGLPRHGWLSILAGQVIASVTALFQHFLFIHAGAVAIDGRGVVIVGESGAGKTSTVAVLLRMGGIYYSDEVALFDQTTKTLHPFAFPMSVKPWTKKAVGRLPSGENIDKEGKVQFLLPAHTAIALGTVPVDAFIMLKKARGDGRIASVSRAEMLMNIATHSSSFTYRHRSEEAFAGFGRLLQGARCYVLESSSPSSIIHRFKESFSNPLGPESRTYR